ncbi:MAG TPA: ATP-binding protein [Puia sp.]|jgi:signal transduction histidine kinase
MPDNQYKEVLIVLVACITLFLILAAIILFFLFLYQRRRYVQQQQMAELQLQFREQSMKAQLEIQEQTFHAISQEIHDNVGQVLSLAKVQINIMNESERMDKGMLQDVRENIGKAMSDLRDLARSMSSDRVRSCTLHETLLQEAERINKTGIIRVEVTVEGDAREIEAQKKLILFRIIQEGIQNCIKHAGAGVIFIRFGYYPEAVHISIRDEGKGFDPAVILQGGNGMGLGNIRTRVHLTGGTHTIESGAGEGTHIRLTIPYE